jgi:hypothetical protein
MTPPPPPCSFLFDVIEPFMFISFCFLSTLIFLLFIQ